MKRVYTVSVETITEVHILGWLESFLMIANVFVTSKIFQDEFGVRCQSFQSAFRGCAYRLTPINSSVKGRAGKRAERHRKMKNGLDVVASEPLFCW